MNDKQKTHYRKAFNSPYLSSADIVEPTVLTISHVELEMDKTKKTKDAHNTAYFTVKELRPGEPLKPMILNACNSKTMKGLCNSPFIDDWHDVTVTIYVDPNVRFGRETVEGLRIDPTPPVMVQPMTRKQAAIIQECRDAGMIDPAKLKYIDSHDLSKGDAERLIVILKGDV